MPRFIVRMRADIRGNTRWRTGVELQDRTFGSTRAVVRADENAKRIYIAVGGKQKRDYFSAIRKSINDINRSFEKLSVTELVPLPDVSDILIDYRELIGYELAGREEYFIGRLGKGYSVQSLLNGIEDKAARRKEDISRIVHVQGDYFERPATFGGSGNTMVKGTVVSGDGRKLGYQPQNWGKAVTYSTGLGFFGVVCFLLIRNQPISDPNLVVALRTLLSLTIAIFGAALPGLLRVDFSKKGMAIRATGALALFVISFLLTPKVLEHAAK